MPQCNRELDAEPVGSSEGLAVACSCPEHGAVSVIKPFAGD